MDERVYGKYLSSCVKEAKEKATAKHKLFKTKTHSKYVGVTYIKQKHPWIAFLYHPTLNRKYRDSKYIGCFKNEEDAAKAVNFKCQELNIKLKNPSVGVLNNETFEKLRGKVIIKYTSLINFLPSPR